MSNPQSHVVLLVDDDLDVLGANSRFLRAHDFEVVVADSADTAIARLADQRIDVIVTDLRMPNCSGLEFAVQVRESRPLVPIVFLSGYAQVPDVVSAMKLGAVEFLEKPVEPDELLQVLHRLQRSNVGIMANPRQAFDGLDQEYSLKMRVLAYEKYLIESSLIAHEGNIAGVLDSLQINRRTLNDKMAKLGISRASLISREDD